MERLLDRLLDRDVVFFGGKGGVGKTTCSAAFALAASRRGRRVLLVSTDPAHSTADIFERRIGGAERELLPGLSAVEIDAEGEAARYIRDVKRDIARMFSPGVIRQAHRQIDMAAASPGLAEVALLDRMIDLIVAARLARRHVRSDRLRHGADRPHAAAAADARRDDHVDSGAGEAPARAARDRRRRRRFGGAGRCGSDPAGAPAPAPAPRDAAGSRDRPRADLVRARHDSRAAGHRRDGARRRSAERHGHRCRRADRQPRAARRPGRGVLHRAQGPGGGAICAKSARGFPVWHAPTWSSSRAMCTGSTP